MKQTVIMTGTNCSGKTTIARAIIDKYGVAERTKNYLITNNGIAFIGRYTENSNYGGVDSLNGTLRLKDIGLECLSKCDVVIAEGVYCGTFGNNMLNYLFLSSKQHFIYIYASVETIIKRMEQRSGKTITYKTILNKSKTLPNTLKKYKKIGVQTLAINTDLYNPNQSAELILQRLKVI